MISVVQSGNTRSSSSCIAGSWASVSPRSPSTMSSGAYAWSRTQVMTAPTSSRTGSIPSDTPVPLRLGIQVADLDLLERGQRDAQTLRVLLGINLQVQPVALRRAVSRTAGLVDVPLADDLAVQLRP